MIAEMGGAEEGSAVGDERRKWGCRKMFYRGSDTWMGLKGRDEFANMNIGILDSGNSTLRNTELWKGLAY